MSWELELMRWGAGWWASPTLDRVIPWVTHLGSTPALLLFILISWAVTRRKNVLGGLVLLGTIQSAILYGLKFLVQRPRPFLLDGTLSRLSGGSIEVFEPSFPSAHTLNAFMMATLLASWYPRYRILFYLSAAFTGWSRLYLGMHYPTDVIAGGLIGYGITKLFLHYRKLRCKEVSNGEIQV